MAGFEPLVHGICIPEGPLQTPCGLRLLSSIALELHEQTCPDCRAYLAVHLIARPGVSGLTPAD